LQDQKAQYDNKEQELKQQIASAKANIEQIRSQQDQEKQQSMAQIQQIQQDLERANQQAQQSSSRNKEQTVVQIQQLQQQLSETQQSYNQKQAELNQQLQASNKTIASLQSELETTKQQTQQQVATLTLQINDDKKRADQRAKEQSDKQIAEERATLDTIRQKVQEKNNLIDSILDAQITLEAFGRKIEEVDRIIRDLNDMQGAEQKKSYASLPDGSRVAALNSIENAITKASGKKNALSIAQAALDKEQNAEKTTFKTATQKVNEAIEALMKAKNHVSNVKNEADIQSLAQVIQQQDANVTAQNEYVTKLQEKKHLANEKTTYDAQRTLYESAKTQLTVAIELKRAELTQASQNVFPPTPLPPITTKPPLSASGVSSALSAPFSDVSDEEARKGIDELKSDASKLKELLGEVSHTLR
jgi:hypothetical protein